jgi:hypothetical protein
MTVDQIERAVEIRTDALDRRLMSGQLSQAEYDAKMKALGQWAEREYDIAERVRIRLGEPRD